MQTIYLAQLVFAGILVSVTCLSNVLLIPTSKWSSREMFPFLVNSVIFDSLVVISGPLMFFLSNVFGTTWFDGNSRACHAVEFLQSYSISGSLLALGILAWSHRKTHSVPQPQGTIRVMTACSWILPIGFGCYTLFVRSDHSSQIPWFVTCSSSTAIVRNIGLNYPLIEAINVVLAALACAVTVTLVYLGRISDKKYHVQFQWNRHKRETHLNSPECSTLQFSESTSISMERHMSVVSLNKMSPYFPAGYFLPQTKKQQRKDSTNTDVNEVFYDKGLKTMLENGEHYQPSRSRHNGESRSVVSQTSSTTERPSCAFEFVKTVIPPSDPHTLEEFQSKDLENSPCFEQSPMKYHPSVPDENEYHLFTPRDNSLYNMSPISPYPSPPGQPILSFRNLKKLKSIKWVFTMPRVLEFEKQDRNSQDFKSLIFIITCISLIGWLWLGVIFVFRIALGDVPVELWCTSTWLVYLKLPFSSILYMTYFAEEWLNVWRMKWYHRKCASSVEMSTCSYERAGPNAVYLTKLTLLSY